MFESNFRLIREKNELTVRELAKILNISKSLYSNIENKNQFTIDTLVNFCNYFKVSSDYALGITKINSYIKTNYVYDSKIFAERLRNSRKKKGLTQAKLANKLHINQSMISSYENNKTKMQGIFLYPLSKELNVSTDYLIGLSNVYNRLPN